MPRSHRNEYSYIFYGSSNLSSIDTFDTRSSYVYRPLYTAVIRGWGRGGRGRGGFFRWVSTSLKTIATM